MIKWFTSKRAIIVSSPIRAYADSMIDNSDKNCMILHPITYPNHGPEMEQYFAEEAVGLAKCLALNIVKGPFWNKQNHIPRDELDEYVMEE